MNVVYIDIDSLRADHVGSYGYEHSTTPNIDEVAEDGVRFNNAYVANSPCLPSRAASISGRYGINNGVETHGPSAQVLNSPQTWKQWYACWAEQWEQDGREWLAESKGESKNWLTLPEAFFHERIRTSAVSSFPRHTAPWFYHLWHEYHHPQEPDEIGEYMQTPRAEDVVETSIECLKRHSEEDFFHYVQFWDPHAPYNRTEEQIEQFRGGSLPPHPTEEQIEMHNEWEAWRSAKQLGISDRDDLADLIAHYDAEISHVDHHLSRLFSFLRDEGLYDSTLIVITADHGEEFGEHGIYREHWSTHDGTQRVPLIVKPPNSASTEGGAREQLVTNVDLAPTLVDYAGINTPESWQGASLRPLIEDPSTSWRNRIIFDHGLYTAQRAVRTDRWKLIQTHHPGMWESVTPEYQLFDMNNDPHEQNNLADAHPETVQKLSDEIAIWQQEHVGVEEDTLHAVARNGPAGYRGQKHRWKGV